MSITVNAADAKTIMVEAMKAKLVPMMVGSPAVGKSSIVKSIAEDFNLELIDLRLSQCDPTDLLGFPHVDKEAGKATYVPMSTFPIEGDVAPSGKRGWLLFLDEFNSADRAVQKAAYKLTLDRMVGEYKIHDDVAILCAGNLATDNAIVEEMSTALQSRLIHLELVVDSKQWLDWASLNNIDHRICAYINFKPTNLYKFSANHDNKTYASPRTWEFASRLLQNMGITHPLLLEILSGTISEGVAREFLGFIRIYENLPSIVELIANGGDIPVPQEKSVLYALTGSIGANADENTIAPLMKFINRIPIEFQVVTMRDLVRRKPELIKHIAVEDWIDKNTTELWD